MIVWSVTLKDDVFLALAHFGFCLDNVRDMLYNSIKLAR